MQLTLEFTDRGLTQAEWDAVGARHTERLKRAHRGDAPTP